MVYNERELLELVKNWVSLYLTERIDYDDSGNMIYAWYAPAWTAENEAKWIIMKYEYNENWKIIAKKFADWKAEFKYKRWEKETYTYL